jgi:hypothetical protein
MTGCAPSPSHTWLVYLGESAAMPPPGCSHHVLERGNIVNNRCKKRTVFTHLTFLNPIPWMGFVGWHVGP